MVDSSWWHIVLSMDLNNCEAKLVAIYARSATEDLCDGQVAACKDYVSVELPLPTHELAAVIVDSAKPGTCINAGLQHLLTLVRDGRISVVVCYRHDRLARDLAILDSVRNYFRQHSVALHSVGERRD